MGERDLMGAAEMLRSGECQLCPNLRAERAGTGDTRSRGQEVGVLLSVTTLHHSYLSVTQCYNSSSDS